MRCLLTAFEPFDGTGRNSSLEACRLFLERHAGSDVGFAVLPVEYGPDVQAVERAISRDPVGLVLHTGQATDAEWVRVERLAVNVRFAEAAPQPWGRPEQRIEADGPAAVFSPLPVDEIAAAIRAAGVPGAVSSFAGIYMCNHVLYHSLRRAERGGPPAGFLHIPRLPEQSGEGRPSLPVEQSARAIAAALACLKVNPSPIRTGARRSASCRRAGC